ncbi:MAG TPA: UTP--glucose-1-phosphate uridylyltransferase, partial [Clostridiaceae bacterium]|nr:UTP--glucose-1-phosphate uridylyltransferase [Clostridiaceae bacterium]
TGVGNEIQLTDGIRLLNNTQTIYACKFKGKRFDTGDRLGYVKSIVDFALENETLREDVLEYLREILEADETLKQGKIDIITGSSDEKIIT